MTLPSTKRTLLLITAIVFTILAASIIWQLPLNEKPITSQAPLLIANPPPPLEPETELEIKETKTNNDMEKILSLLKPGIRIYNQQITTYQKRLARVKKDLTHDLDISEADFFWLKSLTFEFRIPPARRKDKELFRRLDNRVIHLDENFVLAAALVLSNNGTSKAALTLNNYYSLYCFAQGCGSIELSPDPELYEIERFATPQDSTLRFMEILNAEDAYSGFRQWRKLGSKLDAFPENNLLPGTENADIRKALLKILATKEKKLPASQENAERQAQTLGETQQR